MYYLSCIIAKSSNRSWAIHNFSLKHKSEYIPKTPPRKKASSSTKIVQKQTTYNSRYSLVVTHPTTNLPIYSLYMGERTGSLVLCNLWSYVSVIGQVLLHITRKTGPTAGINESEATSTTDSMTYKLCSSGLAEGGCPKRGRIILSHGSEEEDACDVSLGYVHHFWSPHMV